MSKLKYKTSNYKEKGPRINNQVSFKKNKLSLLNLSVDDEKIFNSFYYDRDNNIVKRTPLYNTAHIRLPKPLLHPLVTKGSGMRDFLNFIELYYHVYKGKKKKEFKSVRGNLSNIDNEGNIKVENTDFLVNVKKLRNYEEVLLYIISRVSLQHLLRSYVYSKARAEEGIVLEFSLFPYESLNELVDAHKDNIAVQFAVRNMDKSNEEILNLMLDWFILDLPVSAIGIRPTLTDTSSVSGTKKHPMTLIYNNIYSLADELIKVDTRTVSDFLRIWNNLSNIISNFISSTDSEKAKALSMLPANCGDLVTIPSALGTKYGLGRNQMLRVRTEFSARSVLNINPELSLYDIEIPYKMMLGIFNTQIRLKTYNLVPELREDKINRYLKEVIEEGLWVCQGRQPTLHPLSIQAFRVVGFTKGNTININPLITKAFNADFDGDTVHLQFFNDKDIIAEVQTKIGYHSTLSSARQLKPKVEIEAETIYGLHLIKMLTPTNNTIQDNLSFSNYWQGIMSRKFNWNDNIRGKTLVSYMFYLLFVEAGVGQLSSLFTFLNPEGKASSQFKELHQDLLTSNISNQDYLELLRRLLLLTNELVKAYPVSISPLSKVDISINYDKMNQVNERLKKYKHFLNDTIFNTAKIGTFNELRKEANNKLTQQLNDTNGYKILEVSGAKGGLTDYSQLYVNKGITQKDKRHMFNEGIRSSFKQGLSSIEQSILSFGGRQGMVDKTVNTYAPGEFSFELVNGCQLAEIITHDCGDTKGFTIYKSDLKILDIDEDLWDNIVKAVTSDRIVLSRGGGHISFRSPISCKAQVCQKCFGLDFMHMNYPIVGTNIGILSATVITEPITQLSMKSFQKGGTTSESDLTSFDYLKFWFKLPTEKLSISAEMSDKNYIVTDIQETANKTIIYTKVQSKETKRTKIFEREGDIDVTVGNIYEEGDKLFTNKPYHPRDLTSYMYTKKHKCEDNDYYRLQQVYILLQTYLIFNQQNLDINLKYFETVVNEMMLYRSNNVEDFGEYYSHKEVVHNNMDISNMDKVLIGVDKLVHRRRNLIEAIIYKDMRSVLSATKILNTTKEINSNYTKLALGV